MIYALKDRYMLLLLLLGLFVSFAAALEHEMENQLGFSIDLSLHRCSSERGSSSYGREEWLNRLNRQRVVFIGDSITRCAGAFTRAVFDDLLSPEHQGLSASC
jgi:hypothetical protein